MTTLTLVAYSMTGVAAAEGLTVFAATRKGDLKETFSNVGIWVLQQFWREAFATAGVVIILKALRPFAPSSLPATWWAWALAIFAADFIYYWKHRLEHEIRALWAYHSVHHSSNYYNLSTAVRLPVFGSLSSAIFHAPMLFFGFSVEMILVARILVLMYQYWIHTEHIEKLGWFDNYFNTPSNHRVHHGSNPQYLDKNYAGILLVWDKWFGTFEPETEKVVYGLTKPIGTQNPLLVNLREPLAIVKDLRGAKNVTEAFQFVFGAPGWVPRSGTKLSVTPSLALK